MNNTPERTPHTHSAPKDSGGLYDILKMGQLECELIIARGQLEMAQEEVDEIEAEIREMKRTSNMIQFNHTTQPQE